MYEVIKKRTRIAKIKIGNDFKVRIIVPMDYSKQMIEDLIRRKNSWIENTINRMKSKSKNVVLLQNEILLFGEKYVFELNDEIENKILTYNEKKKIVSNLNLPERRSLLVNWYKHLAKKYITVKALELAEKHNFRFERIFIRDQKTKWGTCSERKNISFNWRLIMCPEFVIDYLIIHELSHLKEMNHSKKFWEEVAKIIPDYKRAKKWLLEYESYIFGV